jgi:protocatechuate 3,4-dioxygenase beta subunit
MLRVALAALALTACGREHRDAPASRADETRRAFTQLVQHIAPATGGVPARVIVAGTVVDSNGAAVPNVEVIARGRRTASTRSAADGSFRFSLPPGEYGLYVDDDRYMSAAARQNPRIHGGPRAVTAGVRDEALVARIDATTNRTAVDVRVVRSVRVTGVVTNQLRERLSAAVVRATCGQRPVLGTDVAISDAEGRYELRLPAGERCVLDAMREDYAGIVGDGALSLGWDVQIERNVVLNAGCIVTGKVIDARGEPAGDGAVEEHFPGITRDFGPGGEITPDGTFRWASTQLGSVVTLRAWPWRSPPSAELELPCLDGTVVDNIVFRLPAMTADLDGVLLDRAGAPVPFAFIDMVPRSQNGVGQQERTDAQGRWQFHDVPAGPYALHAHVPGRGIVSTSIMSPQSDPERLVLGATARLTGTTTALVDGSFELSELTCKDFANDRFPVQEPPRIVPVQASSFAIGGLPACKLAGKARWRNQEVAFEADLAASASATVELDLGKPRAKRVYGIVRDENGEPVANATVAARAKAAVDELTRTDDEGRYSLTATSGAVVHASQRTRSAERQVGGANIDEERIDLVLRAP